MSDVTDLSAGRPGDAPKGVEADLEMRFRDSELRRQELELKSREQWLNEKTLKLKEGDQRSKRWSNPLMLAIAAATIGALGNAYVSWEHDQSELVLEEKKEEGENILKLADIHDPADKLADLKLLRDLGVIQSDRLKADFNDYINNAPLIRPAAVSLLEVTPAMKLAPAEETKPGSSRPLERAGPARSPPQSVDVQRRPKASETSAVGDGAPHGRSILISANEAIHGAVVTALVNSLARDGKVYDPSQKKNMAAYGYTTADSMRDFLLDVARDLATNVPPLTLNVDSLNLTTCMNSNLTDLEGYIHNAVTL